MGRACELLIFWWVSQTQLVSEGSQVYQTVPVDEEMLFFCFCYRDILFALCRFHLLPNEIIWQSAVPAINLWV